jgi:hypothetical protein
MSSTSERLMGGPRAGRSVVPTASQSVKVESDDRIEGVRLSAVATTAAAEAGVPPTAADDEDAALLLRFSPDFIVFPDATADASPPFKDGRNDYHPRPVEAFLDGARPYVATPGGLLAGLYVAAVATLATGIGALMLLVAVVRFDAVGTLNWLLAISAVAALVLWTILARAAPATTSALRDKVARGEDTSRLGIRSSVADPPDTIWARWAWDDYRKRVVPSEAYPRTAYGRVVAKDDDRYLEYWQFYVFNDWHNRHEADWELVVIRVSRGERGWVPRAAAYSSHYGGHWRDWEDLETRDGEHPLVYVARGSHAQYFESRPEGYRATLTQPLELLELRIRLTVQNDWKDVVAASVGPVHHPYRLAVIPTGVEDNATPTRAETDAWWWLRFEGLWGGRAAINGPASQGLKWTDPQAWVRLAVDRDVDDLDAFAVTEGRG